MRPSRSTRRPGRALALSTLLLCHVPSAAAPAPSVPAPSAAAPAPSAPAPGPARASIVADLAARIDRATARDAADMRIDRLFREPVAEGIFLHPRGEADRPMATLTWEIALPRTERGERLLLTFATRLRPGFGKRPPPDGVRFVVEVDGEHLFERLQTGPRWTFRALDLSRFAGRAIRLSLGCHRNGTANWDWSQWGDPRVLRIRPGEGLPGAKPSLWVGLRDPAGRGPVEAHAGATAYELAGAGDPVFWIPANLVAGAPPPITPPPRRLLAVRFAVELEVDRIALSAALPRLGARAELRARIRNAGLGAYAGGREAALELDAPEALQFLAHDRTGQPDPAARAIPPLEPGETAVLAWPVRIVGRGRARGTIALESQRVPFDLAVDPVGEDLETIALEARGRRLVFLREGERVRGAILEVRAGDRWSTIGAATPIAEVASGGGVARVERARIEANDREVLLEAPVRVGELEAACTIRFRLDRDPWIEVDARLEGEGPLARFACPVLRAGEAAFGEAKDQGLFCGVEYLRENEPSSSTRSIAPPWNARTTVHPRRVTIPLMAIRKGRSLAGLAWDPLREWAPGERHATAVFSSPNRLDLEANHLLALAAPSVPRYLREGSLEVARPFRLGRGRPVRLHAWVLLEGGAGDITDAVRRWVERFGLPEVVEPRSFLEEIRLSRIAWLESVWDAKARAHAHCVGWPPANSPCLATMLLLDSYITDDADDILERRIDLMTRKILREEGPGALARGTNCHIAAGEYPFYHGHVPEGVEALVAQARGIAASQEPDGSWRWWPDEKRAGLGKAGDRTQGIIAGRAYQILRRAIVAGDRGLIAKGLRGIDYVNRTWRVPFGAQPWECPIYAPDVLGAAHAVLANVRAYQATGDRAYLEAARHWAWTGVPFVYLWGEPSIPPMRYASTSIFGATFYTHSWLGRPVQWTALIYAYGLGQLARFDRRPGVDWEALARGIVAAGCRMQYADRRAPNRGTLPDSWDLIENHPNPADIQPESIMTNVHALAGFDPGIKTVRVGDRFASSAAEIEDAREDGGETALRLRFFRGRPFFTLTTDADRAPAEVLHDGVRVPRVAAPDAAGRARGPASARAEDPLRSVPEGWRHIAGRGWLVIKLRARGTSDRLRIRWR